MGGSLSFFKVFIYLFIHSFIHAALALPCGTQDLPCGMLDLLVAACGLLVVACMQDLAPRPGIEPRPPALGARSLPGKSRETFLKERGRWCVCT